jgi:hypothetical protein
MARSMSFSSRNGLPAPVRKIAPRALRMSETSGVTAKRNMRKFSAPKVRLWVAMKLTSFMISRL